jgi:hypothetical protein
MYTAMRPSQPVALGAVLPAVTSEMRKRPLALTLAEGRHNVEHI